MADNMIAGQKITESFQSPKIEFQFFPYLLCFLMLTPMWSGLDSVSSCIRFNESSKWIFFLLDIVFLLTKHLNMKNNVVIAWKWGWNKRTRIVSFLVDIISKIFLNDLAHWSRNSHGCPNVCFVCKLDTVASLRKRVICCSHVRGGDDTWQKSRHFMMVNSMQNSEIPPSANIFWVEFIFPRVSSTQELKMLLIFHPTRKRCNCLIKSLQNVRSNAFDLKGKVKKKRPLLWSI